MSNELENNITDGCIQFIIAALIYKMTTEYIHPMMLEYKMLRISKHIEKMRKYRNPKRYAMMNTKRSCKGVLQ